MSARAFSLLEVMLSATVLTVGIAGSLSGYQTVQQVYRQQRHMTQAIQIAEAMAEELLFYPSSGPWMRAGEHPAEPLRYDRGARRVSTGGIYRVQWTVTPSTPITEMRRIDVHVRWDDVRTHDFYLTVHR